MSIEHGVAQTNQQVYFHEALERYQPALQEMPQGRWRSEFEIQAVYNAVREAQARIQQEQAEGEIRQLVPQQTIPQVIGELVLQQTA